MCRGLFVLFLFLYVLVVVNGQDTYHNLYNPNADAKIQLDSAISVANNGNKHVLVQVGGNWCKWCIKLHRFLNDEPVLDSMLTAGYIFVPVNYSKENRNFAVMEQLGYPQRFGFPVLVILDSQGRRLHTQDTWFLEEGEGYSREKIKRFLESWNVRAVSKDTYQNRLP
ncbi:MAG: thioredoxin family protein [Bacteroidales bacterium]|nr:thioredoxin family protein [Bacteroidales bacterium]